MSVLAIIVAVVGYGWFFDSGENDDPKGAVADATTPDATPQPVAQPPRKTPSPRFASNRRSPIATTAPRAESNVPTRETQERKAPMRTPTPVAEIKNSAITLAAEANDRDDKPATQPSPQDPNTASLAASDRQLSAGIAALRRGELIAARDALSSALIRGLPADQARQARNGLYDIAEKTVFSSAIVDGDPLVTKHVVQPGEALAIIAKRYNVTADLIAAINNIQNKNMIRAGQTLKVVNGPFHAVIDKRAFVMDLYLNDTLVRQYPVGLGANDNTPTGDWEVGTKLTNPDYYPPRGGRKIAADDPENPLGEYWIALVGISGEAVGQQRYGIHGTNEPDSIGKDMSLGCVRMHNPDVAQVYAMLIPNKSKVRIHD